jgi:hypothetical protein
MKRLLVLSLLALAVFATCAAANPIKGPWGNLVPSPIPTRTDLMICDTSLGILNIYVILNMWPGATAVQFSAPRPPCFTATYLADAYPFAVTIGNSQTGVGIGFGTCRVSPVHVLTMTFLAYGTTPPDCVYPTRADPAYSSWIEIVDCAFMPHWVGDGGNYINPPEAGCGTIPAETMTWGQVKSLFTE